MMDHTQLTSRPRLVLLLVVVILLVGRRLGGQHSWADSDIFSNDMYGSAMNSPDNQYQISEGWFKDVHSLYDPDSTFVADIVSPGHNLFGYIDARFNMQRLPGVARTASYCELRGEIEFATCNVVINCFDDNDNISDWNSCMEDQVHAANHGMIGGGFNCNVSFKPEEISRVHISSGSTSPNQYSRTHGAPALRSCVHTHEV